jgi:hypothetical protein
MVEEGMFICRRRGIQPASADPSRSSLERFAEEASRSWRRRAQSLTVSRWCRLAVAVVHLRLRPHPRSLGHCSTCRDMGCSGHGRFPRLPYLPPIQPSSHASSGRFSQPECACYTVPVRSTRIMGSSAPLFCKYARNAQSTSSPDQIDVMAGDVYHHHQLQ